MKKTTFVALLLLSTQCLAEMLSNSLQDIDSEWAKIYYGTSRQEQGRAYAHLLDKIMALSHQYPANAEAIFWQAVVKASYAEHQDPISALDAIQDARNLLTKVIQINPKAMNGSAYTILGTLYYMAPKWPISFGDDAVAQEMLQAGLKINPNGIDTNYFYGDFLLSNNFPREAEKYFEKALAAPIRSNQPYSDNQLKEEAEAALKKAKQ